MMMYGKIFFLSFLILLILMHTFVEKKKIKVD